MATNYDSVKPVGSVKRWDRAKGQFNAVPQPHLFKEYNLSMGGVDLVDAAINVYRINIKGKRWYYVIGTYFLDLAMVNAWRVYQISNKKDTSQLEFRQQVVRSYLMESAASQSRPSSKRNSASNPPVSLQLFHCPVKMGKQLRCTTCHMRTSYQCDLCNVSLCLEKRGCFKKYHVN